MKQRKFIKAGGGPINDRVDHILYRDNRVGMQMIGRRGQVLGGSLWTLRQAESLVETGHFEELVSEDTPATPVDVELPGGAW